MAQKPDTDELKKEAVRLAASGKKSVAQTARELGINDNILVCVGGIIWPT